MSDSKEYLTNKPNTSVIVDGKILPEKDAKKVKNVLKCPLLKEQEDKKEPTYLKG